MKSKKNLSRKTVRLLRKVQKFLLEEPRRFDMREGITQAHSLVTILEQPPCGTACCIAGAMYAIDKKLNLNSTKVGWFEISMHIINLGLERDFSKKLFYVSGVHDDVIPGVNGWPEDFAVLYRNAKTAYERALIGVARIERFIATDGLQ